MTASGPAAAPAPGPDATGTHSQHPALVTRVALEPPAVAPAAPARR